MNRLFKILVPILLLSPYCFSQDPMPILSSSWQRITQKSQTPDVAATGPARAVLPDDKYFQRKAREQRTDNPMNPDQDSMDARSAAIDKAVQESRTPKSETVSGYTYNVQVRNDTGKTVEVIFWEYSFKELARPENVVRRQFLCGVNLKNGEKKDLSVFSLLGPSDVIDTESLAGSRDKLFNEEVRVNRIELSDGSILQRLDWKYKDVQQAIKRATSTPWGKEICRAL